MNETLLLSRLAAQAGIETRYRDAWAVPQEVPRESIEALLASMGLATTGAGDAADLLSEREAARWGGLLEPVAVVPEEAASILVTVNAPADDIDATVEWSVTAEDGQSYEGRLRFGDTEPQGAGDAAGHRMMRRSLRLPQLPRGYHDLTVRLGAEEGRMKLIVAPPACYFPEELRAGSRVWGLATQLYALRSEHNWGIGDFSDLALLAEGVAGFHARAVGVNPLHALFAAEPRHISPYSPSSRLFLNALYIDVEAVAEFGECEAARRFAALPETQCALAKARDAALVDHVAIAALKRPVFEQLYHAFRQRHLGSGSGGASTPRGEAFRTFQREGGVALRNFAVFEALQEIFIASGIGFNWRDWPIAMRDPASPEVAAFAEEQYEHVEYFEYLQWEADRQLGAASRLGVAAGLSIGLYRDLAVGVDPCGAEAWGEQDLLVPGAAIGAPPDLLNLKGQNWGLAPVNPLALRRRAYAPFIAGLRANMRHAGALRIDHVMALQHVYWVPGGMSPASGAYVSYPFEDLVRILALESHRHRCVVIGEDLGTVPEGFRERMREANVLSYRVLVFERQADGSFTPPGQYPELAAASFGTHDLATLRGYWVGRDLEWRKRLDLYPTVEQRRADEENRARERRLLLDALVREGVLPPDAADEFLLPDDTVELHPGLSEAVHRYLGRSNARFVLAQIEDTVGELEQVNLPGTTDEHPNWRRKLSLSVEEILDDPAFRQLAAVLNEARERAIVSDSSMMKLTEPPKQLRP
jgi:4-alpha-glucanotransferase